MKRRSGGPIGKCARRAFTLIELLVVLTIISVLSALLIPTVGLVRDNARMSECGSRMRQLGAVVLAYTNDWDGWLPASRMISGFTALHTGGTIGLEEYYNLPTLSALQNSKFLLCPEAARQLPEAKSAFNNTNKTAVFKSNNTIWGCYDDNGIPGFSSGNITQMTAISKTSSFFLVFCNGEDWFFPVRINATNNNRPNFLHRPTRPPDGVCYYESGKMNVTFADGHVQAMTSGGTKNPCGDNEMPMVATGANAVRYTANWSGK